MCTQFEALLVGHDAEHLEAVVTLLFDEFERVERLLSRYDPTSEVFRVNQQAAARAVTLSVELAEVLADCRAHVAETGGRFLPLAIGDERPAGLWDALEFDERRRTLRFLRPGVGLDFGGYGKGYALDRGAAILATYGVEHALLHGGASSVLTRGCDQYGQPWRIGLRSLASSDPREEVGQVLLADEALSTSWNAAGDEGCTVIASTAATAEVWSTALLTTSIGGRMDLSSDNPSADPRTPPTIRCLKLSP